LPKLKLLVDQRPGDMAQVLLNIGRGRGSHTIRNQALDWRRTDVKLRRVGRSNRKTIVIIGLVSGLDLYGRRIIEEQGLSELSTDGVTVADRSELERRSFGWRTVFFGFLRSRRRLTRRDSESEPLYTDWHHPWLFFLATGTMLLSCADAFLTLQLIDHGMYEANPAMQAVMAQSTLLFTSTKLAMTAFGILVLVFLAKTRFMNRIRTGLILTIFFSFYACLVCYELVNLFNMS
jgi:hypothetical protein